MVYTSKFSHSKKKNFFEGWYFKHQIDEFVVVFIPGISIDKFGNKKIFIQVINNTVSDWEYYDDYYADEKKLYLKIGNNIFSDEGIEMDFKGKEIQVQGKLSYTKHQRLKKSIYSPSIMGPFSYLSFMECYHGIDSLHHVINGTITCNNKEVDFSNGIGYIERDYGSSFPSSYLWIHCNDLGDNKNCFFLSVAQIPFMKLSFKGLIAVIYIDNKEYRFATYNMAKLIGLSLDENILEIKIKRKKLELAIKAIASHNSDLMAPKNGDMNYTIKECVSGTINLKLFKDNLLLYEANGKNVGIEYHDISNIMKE